MIATPVEAVACAVPFAEAQAAISPCSCDSPPGNPGGGGYCIPGDFAPLPTPGRPYPTPASGSPSTSEAEPEEPEEPEGLGEDEPIEEPGEEAVAYPCLAPVFPAIPD